MNGNNIGNRNYQRKFTLSIS